MATQYFEHKLELGSFAEQAHFQLLEWHPTLSILALASINSGTNIFFYGEDVRSMFIAVHYDDFFLCELGRAR